MTTSASQVEAQVMGIGNKIAPWRFLVFLGIMCSGIIPARQFASLPLSFIGSFDIAAIVFLLLCLPLLKVKSPAKIRESAIANDANRPVLLVITSIVLGSLLVALTLETVSRPEAWVRVLIVGTLVVAWLFSNIVYALHYAHMAYWQKNSKGKCEGFDFPGTPYPIYSDFVYFAFTCGMAFATSDVQITSQEVRKIVTFHALAAFAFNIGALAFTVNLLASGG